MASFSKCFILAILASQAYSLPQGPYTLVPNRTTSENLSAIAYAPNAQTTVPSFVTEYAPVVYLHSQEKYFPSDIGAQVANTRPEINFTVVSGAPDPLTLDNLDALNALGGKNISLTSIDDTTKDVKPEWLLGVVPDSTGKTEGAVSCAIIVNDYGNGTVDGYYMFFYAYNWGGIVIDWNFDDHVGDWEHAMIKFENGVPATMWYSIHQSGEAFEFSATPKYNDTQRPIVYSANGSHANYATSGQHDHTIPGLDLPIGDLLEDYTDQGYLWDPTLNAYYASVNFPAGSTTPVFSAYDDTTPINWLNFVGAWGDAQYPKSTDGQFSIFGQAHFTGGPTGPEDKDLNRGESTCPAGIPDPCIVLPKVLPGN